MTAVDFNNLDLDALRAEAENKYKNLTVRGVVFRGLMRVSKDDRKQFNDMMAARKAGESQDEDVTEFYRRMLMLVAEDKDEAEKLLDEVGEDAAVLDTLVTLYFERTQVGEA